MLVILFKGSLFELIYTDYQVLQISDYEFVTKIRVK